MEIEFLKPHELKSKRIYYQMEQTDLAKELGMSGNSISRAERGRASDKILSQITLYFKQRDEKEMD